MAKQQTQLEKEAIVKRQEETIKNSFATKVNEYDENNDKAESHPNDASSQWGKGTRSGGHTFSLPDHSKPKNQFDNDIDVNNGGSGVDINGKNGKSGRNVLTTINLYNKDNAYGVESVDTLKNVSEGQYIVE